MPSRSLSVDGAPWRVYPSGFITQYDRDEFGIVFVRGEGAGRELRFTRYSPNATRSREQSLAELSDDQLRTLFASSQPGDTSPEAGYTG
jgi:hypothetical protein